jgi:hypothetical protein
MDAKRTHIMIPDDLAAEIDAIVGKHRRSQFLVDAARRELKRLRMLAALERAEGAWKEKDHPELRAGADRWVARQRREAERRFRRVTRWP